MGKIGETWLQIGYERYRTAFALQCRESLSKVQRPYLPPLSHLVWIDVFEGCPIEMNDVPVALVPCVVPSYS